MISYYW